MHLKVEKLIDVTLDIEWNISRPFMFLNSGSE